MKYVFLTRKHFSNIFILYVFNIHIIIIISKLLLFFLLSLIIKLHVFNDLVFTRTSNFKYVKNNIFFFLYFMKLILIDINY